MRNTNYTQALTSTRKLKSRVTFVDKLMRFSNLQASEDISLYSTDSDLYGTDLLRVGIQDGTSKVYFAQHAENDAGFVDTTWTDTGLIAVEFSRLGLYGNRLFYQNSGGGIAYADKGATSFGAEVGTGITYNEPVAIAPVSSTEFYVIQLDWDGNGAYAMRRVFFHTISGTTEEYHGRLYGDASTLNIVDAVRLNGVDYVYFLDNTEKRTVYIKKSGDWWSEVFQVVPMDVVDDMTSFVLTSANVINDIVVVTGVISRTYGSPFYAYMVGPEEFTAGKEFFIRPEGTAYCSGKLHLFDGKTWFVGDKVRYYAEQTMYLGVNNPNLTVTTEDILSFTHSGSGNSAFSVVLNMFHDFTHIAFRPGSEAKLEVAVNDEYSNLGIFNVDGFAKPIEASGSALDISMRSDGYKRLAQWTSDTSYDYWSQTKLDADPSELTDLVRVNGSWTDGDDGLYVEDFNEDCLMYVTAKACRNGIMRAKFIRHSGDFDVQVGVGLNFYKETPYDAAQRLGVEISEVEDNQYGTNGIFAVYGDSEHSGAEGISLRLLKDSFFTTLTSASYTLTPDVPYWLMITFNEGKIDIYIRADSATSWTKAISTVFASYGVMPWRNDDMGRGALLCRNVTPNSTTYPMTSDQTYIPIDSKGTFPIADEVIIGSERMTYTGMSAGSLKKGPYTYRYGKAPWNQNPTPTTNVQYFTSVKSFGRYATSNKYIQEVQPSPSQYLSAISLWVAKAGDPKEDLKISVCEGPANTSLTNISQLTTIAEGYIPSEEIAGANDPGPYGTHCQWVTCKFNGELMASGKNYYLVLERDDNLTNKTDAYAEGTDGYPYENYFGVHVNASYVLSTYSYYCNDRTGAITVNTGIKTLGYILYANICKYNDGNVIHCDRDASLYDVADANVDTVYTTYNDMAIVVTDGAGAGNCYRITGYQEYQGTCAFHLDRDCQDVLDDTSIFYIVPTLIGVTRGTNSTIATAHTGDNLICHLYRDRPFASINRVQYYSSEIDNSLEDIVRIIVRKAGVRNLNGVNLYPDQIIPSTNALVLDRKNFRVEFDFSAPFDTDTIIISGRRETTSGAGANIVISETGISYYSDSTLNETFTLDNPLSGKVVVTYFNNHASIWCNGRFLYSFTLKETEVDGTYFTVIGTHASPVNVYVPEAMIRIDNYILDAGQRGDSLVTGVIGEKRFFLADDLNGDMLLFRERVAVNSDLTPYELTVAGGEVQSDASVVTRMRLEGTDIKEKFDTDLVVSYGNIFYMANMYEINSPADAEWFADVLLDNMGSRIVSKAYDGAADPRVEPNDIVWVHTKDGTDRIIVDTVQLIYTAGEGSAAFDMILNGRIPKADLI